MNGEKLSWRSNSRLQMTPDDSRTEHLSTRCPSNKKSMITNRPPWKRELNHGCIGVSYVSWQNKWRVSFHPASGSVYGSLALIHSWRWEWHCAGSGIVSGVLWLLWFETTQKKWGARWFSGRVSRVAGYKRLWQTVMIWHSCLRSLNELWVLSTTTLTWCANYERFTDF